MKIKCNNTKCNWEWEYKGDKTFYATCPNCYNKVKIPEEPKKE